MRSNILLSAEKPEPISGRVAGAPLLMCCYQMAATSKDRCDQELEKNGVLLKSKYSVTKRLWINPH